MDMTTKSPQTGVKLFGTDGVRGQANQYPMTSDAALRLAMAAGQVFQITQGRVHKVIIGKDTRRSGYMFETAMTAGFTAAGMDVVLLGPMPTPAVGMLTRSMRADLGVMISASHNPADDNGIKFFGPDGYKLSDAVEGEIETYFAQGMPPVPAAQIGAASRIVNAAGRYVEAVKAVVPRGCSLAGLKVVVDCANGAAYRAAPEVLWELGAEVIPIGVSPNGFNINDGVGSTAPEAAAAKVRETGADVGLCLDGDADRIIVIDETGQVADGDQIMGLIAARMAQSGTLAGQTLVATVMSNLGLERWLAEQGIALHRTRVGDRYVVEAMRAGGFNLGGEQSGHIVMSDYATTGDGLLAGLQFLAAMVESGKPASQLARVFKPCPQVLSNVRYAPGAAPLDAPAVQKAIEAAQAELAGMGRVLIRKSGTEPLIRIMVEAEDEHLMERVAGSIEAVITEEVGRS